MASELTAADVTHRLADQLQMLSQVAETLTFRLLDLEERLAGQELQLKGGSAGSDLITGGTELRLAETEGRLTRLESLLESGLPGEVDLAEPVRHLRSVEPDLEVFAPAASDSEAEDVEPDDFEVDDSAVEDLDVVESVAGESVAGEQGAFDPIEPDPMEPDPMDSDPIHLASIHAEQAQDATTTDDFAFRDDPFLEEHEQPFMDELSA
ncbi:MAG: hypothetical protein EBZ76_10335 [Synechococcaceae bacterium WB9_2_170]|nr:hypothetical protein [Synechococcaceae bacterium WB9_2_170]